MIDIQKLCILMSLDIIYTHEAITAFYAIKISITFKSSLLYFSFNCIEIVI